ncbi:hypothetical protein CAP35_01065 [Chitinophagaceae bacterium IBVUCB1]|nr:hypothetical protein CAP35_01065 [Chitinophagaceae bacterium IBVUCB1]
MLSITFSFLISNIVLNKKITFMNGKKLFTVIAAFATALTVIVSACKKDDDDNDDLIKVENTDYGLYNARMEQLMNDALTFTQQSYVAGKLNMKSTAFSCATVTVDTANRTVIVDFGTEYCLCKDSRKRKGRIIRRYTGKFADTGKTQNVIFDNYYVNDFKVDGTISSTYKGVNAQIGSYYVLSANLSATNSITGEITTRTTEGRRIVKTGANTEDVYDDTYAIEGYGLLTMPNGAKYNYSIEQSLNISPNCDWPLQGIVELTQINGPARVFNYGGIGCDNKATLRADDDTKTLTLD